MRDDRGDMKRKGAFGGNESDEGKEYKEGTEKVRMGRGNVGETRR